MAPFSMNLLSRPLPSKQSPRLDTTPVSTSLAKMTTKTTKTTTKTPSPPTSSATTTPSSSSTTLPSLPSLPSLPGLPPSFRKPEHKTPKHEGFFWQDELILGFVDMYQTSTLPEPSPMNKLADAILGSSLEQKKPDSVQQDDVSVSSDSQDSDLSSVDWNPKHDFEFPKEKGGVERPNRKDMSKGYDKYMVERTQMTPEEKKRDFDSDDEDYGPKKCGRYALAFRDKRLRKEKEDAEKPAHLRRRRISSLEREENKEKRRTRRKKAKQYRKVCNTKKAAKLAILTTAAGEGRNRQEDVQLKCFTVPKKAGTAHQQPAKTAAATPESPPASPESPPASPSSTMTSNSAFGAPSSSPSVANAPSRVSPTPFANAFKPPSNAWATTASNAASPFTSTTTNAATAGSKAAADTFGTMNNVAPSASNPFGRPGGASTFSTNTPPAGSFGAPSNPPQPQPAPTSFTTASQPNHGNPFGSASQNPQPANPFGGFTSQNHQQQPTQFGAPSQPQPQNPFGAPSQPSQQHQSAPFAGASQQQQQTNSFGSSSQSQQQPKRFGSPSQQAQPAPFRPSSPYKPPSPYRSLSPFGSSKNKNDQQQSTPFGPPKKSVHFADDVAMESAPKRQKAGPSPQPSEETRKLSAFAGQYAEKIHDHLRKEGLTAPRWPNEPGNPKNVAAIHKLKEYYKKYRVKVYSSLRKAELIDDPEIRRRLEDAIPFKGICEDMCPDYEEVQRMTENDVKAEEKVPDPKGSDTPWVDPGRMVKKLGRSAAGIEAPLPMDVRSFSALKKSTDYLLGELLQNEEDLPRLHNYLWDRTRSVRKDFTYHTAQRTPEEMQVLCYVFETIARFHAVALHLLCRKGVANEDFDRAQELEQLQNSLKSLIAAYDDCHVQGWTCANEAEFRAYYLVIFAKSHNIMEQVREWRKRPWYHSPHMKIAESIITSLQGFDDAKGPFKQRALGSHFTAPAFANFFTIINHQTVSYTMACVAEVHFTTARRQILQAMVNAYSRKRDWPKDITPKVLNESLCFDTDEEAVVFAQLHGLEFETKPGSSFGASDGESTFLTLKNKNKHLSPSITVRQSHSAKIVESKRNGGQSLAQIFRAPIYKIQTDAVMNGGQANDGVAMDTSDPHQLSEADKQALQYSGPMTSDGDDMFVSNPQYDSYVAAKKRQEEQQLKEQLKQREAKAAKEIEALKQQQQSSSPFATATWTPATGAVNSWTPASSTVQQPPFGTSNASPFGTSNASPFGATTTPTATPPFAAANTTTQPLNGVFKTSTPANPFQPPASPFVAATTSSTPTPVQQSNTAAPVNPFQPPPQQAQNTGGFAPSTVSAPQTGGFSFLGAANKQTQPPAPSGSVFDTLSKQAPSNPFTGFTPSVAATPPTQHNKGAEQGSQVKADTQSANSTTPASSVFSSLPSNTSTPATSFFPQATSTPTTQPASILKAPAASWTPATSNTSTLSNMNTPAQAKPAAPTGSFMLGNYKVAAPSTSTPAPQPFASSSWKPVSVESAPDSPEDSVQSTTTPATSILKPTIPAVSVPIPAAPKIEDPMGGLTKWYVNGDGGLMADFTEFFVATVLEETFQKFQEEEAARLKKEEDDASWTAAREHMTHRLSFKFFNRWRETARRLSHTRILREGAAMRLAYQDELIKKEKARKRAEKKAAERKAAEKEKLEKDRLLLNFTAAADLEKLIRNQQKSRQATEEALLATGIFSGMKDERSAARHVVQGTHLDSVAHHNYHKMASDSPRPASTQSVDSRDMPPPKKEGWKTRSLREMFGKRGSQRRSESFGSSVGTNQSNHHFSHSMPVNGDKKFNLKTRPSEKVTNFSFASRKRSADTSDDEPSANKRKPILSGRPLHWELRARGLVCMPDGRWLPESIALPMQEGKRYPGIGDCGLGPGKPDPVIDDEEDAEDNNKKDPNENSMPAPEHQSPEEHRKSKLDALAKKFGFPPTRKRNYTYSGTPMSYTPISSPGSAASKRKRDDEQDDSPSRNKKQYIHPTTDLTRSEESYSEMSADEETQARIEDTQRMLREMNEMMDTLDEERPVYRGEDSEPVYSEDV